jgi:hypothetical protein
MRNYYCVHSLVGIVTDNTNEVIKLQEENRKLLNRAEMAESSLELKNSSGILGVKFNLFCVVYNVHDISFYF